MSVCLILCSLWFLGANRRGKLLMRSVRWQNETSNLRNMSLNMSTARRKNMSSSKRCLCHHLWCPSQFVSPLLTYTRSFTFNGEHYLQLPLAVLTALSAGGSELRRYESDKEITTMPLIAVITSIVVELNGIIRVTIMGMTSALVNLLGQVYI